MNSLQMFAVESKSVRPLPVPPGARNFTEMVTGMDLGVYSVLRTFDHHYFLHLDDHLTRMAQSMRLLGWAEHLPERRLRRGLDQVCRAYPPPEARVRFDMLRSPPQRLGTSSRLIICLMPLPAIPESYYSDGIQLDFARDLHRSQPLIKTAAFANERKKIPHQENIYEFLLVNERGFILEGTGTNFYGVLDGELRTAGADVLEGITRKILLEQAASLGVPVRLQAIHLDEMPQLTEAAISSSSRALLPAVTIAGRQVGDGRPGPVFRRLLEAYQAYVRTAVRPAVKDG